MKNLNIISILALVILFSCKNEVKKENSNHIQKLNMHGKIESFKEISYIAKLENGKLVKGEKYHEFVTDIDFSQNYDFVINLDTLGRITDYTFFYYDGEIAEKDTCVYYSANDVEESDPAWKIQSLYKRTSEISVDYSTETKASYHYDKFRNLILIDYGDLNKTTFKYDNYKNLIEEKYYDDNGELLSQDTYEYKYDGKNNWVEKVKYEFKIPKYILERKINYY